MKNLFTITLLLLLVIFNSCKIVQKPKQIQINKLFSEQQLQKDEEPVTLKEMTKQFQMVSYNDTITKQTVNQVQKKNVSAQNQTFKKFNKSAINIPVTKIKTIGFSLLKPSQIETGFSKNTNTESNVFSKLATIFLILTLCLIVFFFADSNGLGLTWGGGIILIMLLTLFLCLVFFILGLIFREKSE